MKKTRLVFSTKPLTLLAGFAVGFCLTMPVQAQDSVGGVGTSNCGGTSGLDCKTAGTESSYDGVVQQSFVIDMGQYPSTWGNWYGYAPIRSSRSTEGVFMTNLISAQSSSMQVATVTDPMSPMYGLWTTQGFGPANPESTVAAPEGNLFRVGAGFASFGGDANDIVSAALEVSPQNYNRLYVTRYESATSSTVAGPADSAFGFGGVDANGNPIFRVDDHESTGTALVTGDNWVAVDNAARSATVNHLYHNGTNNTAADAAATSYILDNSATTHSVPFWITAPGITQLGAGGNFAGEYAYSTGTPPGVISTVAHRPSTSDQRGNFSYTHTFTGLGDGNNDAGTGAMLGKSNAGGGPTDSLAVFGIDADGSVDGTVLLTLPGAGGIVDPEDGFDPSAHFSGTTGEFDHYHGTIAFRGGNGQIALAGDRNDPNILYAAATVYYASVTTGDPYNYIAVAKHDVSTGTTTWSIAAYCTNEGGLPDCTPSCLDPGKKVLDGPGGTAVGVIVPLFNVTACDGDLGPSISPPMLDTDGNVYFMAIWEKYLDTDTNGVCDAVDPDSGLFKAHRDAAGAYEIEELISVGNTVYGPNSDTRYQFRFMGVTTSNNVSTGTVWSGNVVQDRIPGAYVNTLDSFDMGGFVVAVSTTYDVDKDLDYARPTGTSPDDATSSDEAYDQLLYVRGYVRTGACCTTDSCIDVEESECDGLAGTFQGVGTVCEFAECTVTPDCAVHDVDCNGSTNAGDILVVRSGLNWNQAVGSAADPRCDVDGNGTCNAGDILVIRSGLNWNTSTGPCNCP